MIEIRKCKLCDKEFTTRPNGHTRVYCYDCSPSISKNNPEGFSINTNAKRHAVKRILIERLGGKCSRCGYDKYQGALHFHHKDPNEKDFQISSKFNNNFEKLYEEVDKCELLCANCHAEIHKIE